MKKRMLSLLLTCALLLGLCASAALAEGAEPARTLYVYSENGKAVTVRQTPNGAIVGRMEVGTPVEVTGPTDEAWAEITFHYTHPETGEGDWKAYVNRRFLIDIEPAELDRLLRDEAESYTGDPLTDINSEFAAAVTVEPYMITVRPARVTSSVPMRWLPSENSMVVNFHYVATEKLRVLKELKHYLQVQDPDTGDVGYIHKKFAAK